MEQNQVKEEVKSISLRSLYNKGAWKTVSNLLINKTGYPFITLLNNKGRAQNLYFSKNSSKIILDTFKEGDNIIEALAESELIETTNSEGNTRFKISISNNSKYQSSSNVEEVFGVSPVNQSEFSLEEFIKGYYSSNLVEKEEEVSQPA